MKIENLEQVETTENKVDATNIIQQDEVDTINKDEPLEIKEIHKFNNQVNNELKKEVVEVGKVGEVEEINLDNLEKNDVFKKTEEEKDKLQEVNLTLDEKDSITLKKPNEIYLDIYRQAREKAKKAKQQAIKAYLEAKRIKELYMLEIVDSSEEDLDSESEDESEEDELFSEN